ncbi:GGDEF domain-containing protein [Vibrio ziniensis]|uniref:diguanylate cyclase n=1 Tax=Vibrio ziniensis TaxID=2711221 RepID=A0A6G7CHY6_9VIBR|nr:diguanylate cyclase [Vibrio ziniensis]QIH41709.1 GGDEF domain-containing protein [Vibrio ziniensis]
MLAMLNIHTVILLLSLFALSPNSYANDRSEWEKVVNKSLSRDPESVLQLLKDRYTSLSPSSEKLYIASRIHEYMTQQGQHYFGDKSVSQLSYGYEEKLFLEGLNEEKNKRFLEAREIYLDLYARMKQRKDSDGIFLFEYHLCRLLNSQGDYFQSQNYCTQLEYLQDIDVNPLIPRYRTLSIIAKNRENLGDYKGALTIYKRLLDELPEGNNAASVFNDIGILLCTLGQYQQSLEYLYRALTLHIENHNDVGIAYTEHSLGEVYYHKGELHQSIVHFNKSRLIHLKQNDLRGLAYVYLGMGKSHTELGAFHEGVNQLLKGLDYAIQYNDTSLKMDVVLALSDSYVQKQYYRQAEYYASKAKTLAVESQNTRTLTQALRQLAKIADLNGKYELALSYYREYVTNEITMRDREHFKAMEALDQSTSSFEQKLLRTELLTQNEQLHTDIEYMKQQRRCFLFLIVALLLVIAHLIHKAAHTKNNQQMDCLTNALHRTVFIKKFNSIGKSLTSETRNVVILFDIDNLKLINDRYGFEIGNQALRSISTTIEKKLNKQDFWGRLGGDEFIVVLRNVEQYEVQQSVETLHKALTSEPYSYKTNDTESKKPLYISASFAFVATASQISDFNQLYAVLDQALYKTKEQGQNCIFNACSDTMNCSFALKSQ